MTAIRPSGSNLGPHNASIAGVGHGARGPLERGHVGRKSGRHVNLSIEKELRGQISIHDSGVGKALHENEIGVMKLLKTIRKVQAPIVSMLEMQIIRVA